MIKIKRAIISVSDKKNLIEFALKLKSFDVELIASGGTAKYLRDNQIEVTDISTVTGNPEAFSGRVKTISFNLISSILYKRGDANDEMQAKNLNISAIDLVVVNLYPFELVARENSDHDLLIENIDIGGPTLIRSAAKNYKHVAVVTDPCQYQDLIKNLDLNRGSVDSKTLKSLALSAFEMIAHYDGVIARHLSFEDKRENYNLTISPIKSRKLRYGENPYQNAWVCPDYKNNSLASLDNSTGKKLSYNNYLDADSACRCLWELFEISKDKSAVVIVKHANPCGVGISPLQKDALSIAWQGDSVSSFGSIVAFGNVLSEDSANFLSDKFIEVIIAPDFCNKSIEILSKKKKLRLLKLTKIPDTSLRVQSILGGFLIQEEALYNRDIIINEVTNEKFIDISKELIDIGMIICKYLKSNAVAIVQKDNDNISLVGAGMGNPNRLLSVKQAIEQASLNKIDLKKCILISDAFFPFKDNIELIASSGIKYIIQPGGSIKDKEVIETCNQYKIAMGFTSYRSFRH